MQLREPIHLLSRQLPAFFACRAGLQMEIEISASYEGDKGGSERQLDMALRLEGLIVRNLVVLRRVR